MCDRSDTKSVARRKKRWELLPCLPPADDWRNGLRMLAESDEPPIILIDMDNTLCDWEGQFRRLMHRHHPDIPLVPQEERRQFKIERNYAECYRERICHLTSLDDFWLSMDPLPNSIEALKEMLSLSLNPFIVTTPDFEFTARSSAEKVKWVERHLGVEWKRRLLIATEKRLVKGDVLIDDKPDCSVNLSSDAISPVWSHLLFSQSYNEDLRGCPRVKNWLQWGPVVYAEIVAKEKRRLESLEQLINENPAQMKLVEGVLNIIDRPFRGRCQKSVCCSSKNEREDYEEKQGREIDT